MSTDRSTDAAVIEKEWVYILFVDPENYTPHISLLSLKDVPSQNACRIKLALLQAFQDIDMPELEDKIVSLASNVASVKAGLATKFLKWLTRMVGFCMVFVWLLRALIKKSLEGVLEPVKKSLIHLFYL